MSPFGQVLRTYLKLSKSDLEVCEQKVRSLAADSTFGSGGSAVGGNFDKFIELDDVAEVCFFVVSENMFDFVSHHKHFVHSIAWSCGCVKIFTARLSWSSC
jgi:hypothetical protein